MKHICTLRDIHGGLEPFCTACGHEYDPTMPIQSLVVVEFRTQRSIWTRLLLFGGLFAYAILKGWQTDDVWFGAASVSLAVFVLSELGNLLQARRISNAGLTDAVVKATLARGLENPRLVANHDEDANSSEGGQ